MWFAARPMPAVARRLGLQARGSGYWIPSLLEAASRQDGLKFAVTTLRSGRDMQFTEDGVDYFVVSSPPRMYPRRTQQMLRCCAQVAESWRPDLIHVHGCETPFGLLEPMGLAPCPVVVSLQGVLEAYREHLFGVLSRREILSACRARDLLTGRGLLWDWWRMGAMVRRERAILAAIRHGIGRTTWDRAQLQAHSPAATYHHVGEILRPVFFHRRWRLRLVDRNCLFVTNARAPEKGLEVLLEAMARLRRHCPNLHLRVAGQTNAGYAAFLRKHVHLRGLDGHVKFLGYLDGDALCEQLTRAHLFVLPSCIENSPNSLGEAMLLGMPCVASEVGGVPSMLDHARTGLLVPSRDPAAMAEAIAALLDNDRMAQDIGDAARQEASRRHAAGRVVKELVSAYRAIVGRDAEPRRGSSLAAESSPACGGLA